MRMRVELKTFWKQAGGHELAVREYNWLTSDAQSGAQATVTFRGWEEGQYLSPYMLFARSRRTPVRFNARWGATLFGGAAGLLSVEKFPQTRLDRSVYPIRGAGLQFVFKPKERMNINLE